MPSERQITDLLDALESDIKQLTRTRDTDTATGRAVMESYALGHLAVLRHALATTPAPADETTEALRKLFNMVNYALDARDALLISKTSATMLRVEAVLNAAPADSEGEPKCLKCGHSMTDRHGECRQCIDWQKHVCEFPVSQSDALPVEKK